MNKGLKITLVVLLAILFTACIGVDCWYLYLRLHNPDTIASKTFEVGLQTLNDEENTTKHFMEVLIHKNEDNSGLASFELKFNYMLDEDQTNFYSQGLQFVADSFDEITWQYHSDKEMFKYLEEPDIFSNYYHHYYSGYIKPSSNVTYYNYQSFDDYVTTTLSTNSINNNSMFKIQLGDNGLYGMKFRSSTQASRISQGFVDKTAFNTFLNESEIHHFTTQKGDYEYKGFYTNFHWNYYYMLTDVHYFSNVLFESIKSSLKLGTNQSIVFEFGDLFEFYKYDEDSKTYSSERIEDSSLIKTEMKTYYSIGVEIKADGLKSAEDSLFNAVDGKMNYNSSDSNISTDYFTGRKVQNVYLDDFVFVETEVGNEYKLKLNSLFLNTYTQYADDIVLNIEINLDEFNDLNIKFVGFEEDCFNGFKIRSCNTIETSSSGEIIKVGVEIND